MPTNPVAKKRGTRARRRVTRRGVVPVLGEMDGKKAGKKDGKRCQNRARPSTITLEKIGFGNNWVYVWVCNIYIIIYVYMYIPLNLHTYIYTCFCLIWATQWCLNSPAATESVASKLSDKFSRKKRPIPLQVAIFSFSCFYLQIFPIFTQIKGQ